MSRKVFISFLGFSNYESIRYAINDDDAKEAEELRFVQEATIKLIKNDFDSEDKIFILTTNGALKNWEDGYHLNRNNNLEEFHEGLKTRLTKLNLKCTFKNLPISDGESQHKIWDVFETIFNKLENNDSLYFDITHGFRSLPMLNMVLINYAKVLKNINVKGIYYGNFDSKKTVGDFIYAPIWDLTSFAELQDWSNASSLFLKTGDSSSLADLISKIGLDSLSNSLLRYSKSINTTRFQEIIKGKIADEVSSEISRLSSEQTSIPVLTPIFEKITEHFDAYKEDNVQNGLIAIDWCIQHGLIHQAYALMSEYLISYVCHIIGIDHLDKLNRETVNSGLSLNNYEGFKFKEGKEDIQKTILEKLSGLNNIKKLRERSKSINLENRHDILHAGMRENPKDPDTLINEALEKFNNLKKVTTCS
jgi:CRISPR-associated Csx2 family protein